MRINLVCVGRLSPTEAALFAVYATRVNHLATLRVIELREVNHDNAATQIARETQEIISAIASLRNPVLLARTGSVIDSHEFAARLQGPEITLIIGGSHGVDDTHFTNQISFGQLTYPHQLFRVMVIEQIFRGLSINRKSPYHK